MDKVHEVGEVSFRGNRMRLSVDGREFEIDISGIPENSPTHRPSRNDILSFPHQVMEFTGRRWMKISRSTG